MNKPNPIQFPQWQSPKSIVGSDKIADLDEAVNDIVQNDPSSMAQAYNDAMAQAAGYLESYLQYLEDMAPNYAGLAKAWADGTEPGGAGTYSAKEWSEKASQNGQLEVWKAAAEYMTARSYATEPQGVYVKKYTSNGDGTFSSTDTTEYSAVHWSQAFTSLGLPTPSYPADEGLVMVAHAAGIKWEEILGTPDETGKKGYTLSSPGGVKKDASWSPIKTNPIVLSENWTLSDGVSASATDGFTIADGITLTVPDGSVLSIV